MEKCKHWVCQKRFPKTLSCFPCITSGNIFVIIWLTNIKDIKQIENLRQAKVYNTSHKFWDQSPSLHYQCCLQVSETVSLHKLWCCYSTNILRHWVAGRGLIYFWKVDNSRIFRNFPRNWLGLNNLCKILSQNLRKLGKQNW